MKDICITATLVLLNYGVASAQIDTLNRKMVPMSQTNERPYKIGSIYFKKGETEPFTGVLFGKYDNGNYLTLQEYEEGIGNGKWVNYYKDGTLKEVGTYRDNLVEGPILQYHPNGNLKAKGNYKHWKKKIGIWKYYDTSGKLVKTASY